MRRHGWSCLVVPTLATLLAPVPAPAETGLASWYGGRAHEGRKMANGARFRGHALTAASRHLPLGTKVHVCRLHTTVCVRVTITDRGPYHHHGRVIDLSTAAAKALGMRHDGLALVSITTEDTP
jgi:rare lipoprotein A